MTIYLDRLPFNAIKLESKAHYFMWYSKTRCSIIVSWLSASIYLKNKQNNMLQAIIGQYTTSNILSKQHGRKWPLTGKAIFKKVGWKDYFVLVERFSCISLRSRSTKPSSKKSYGSTVIWPWPWTICDHCIADEVDDDNDDDVTKRDRAT